ncbi:unnamed protein product, partial [Amoebophrya sp. A120]
IISGARGHPPRPGRRAGVSFCAAGPALFLKSPAVVVAWERSRGQAPVVARTCRKAAPAAAFGRWVGRSGPVSAQSWFGGDFSMGPAAAAPRCHILSFYVDAHILQRRRRTALEFSFAS